MISPTLGELDLGFNLDGVGLFVWASADYNRLIKFWMLRPAPSSKPVRAAFRLIFFACVVGGLWQIGEDARHFGWSFHFCLIATLVCVVGMTAIFMMINLIEWVHRKWLGKHHEVRAQRP